MATKYPEIQAYGVYMPGEPYARKFFIPRIAAEHCIAEYPDAYEGAVIRELVLKTTPEDAA